MLLYLQMLSSDDDREKFEELYSKYRLLMFSIAKEILKNNEDSEDAVHQAFLSLVRYIDKIESVNSPETQSLVSIITKNKAIDIYRKRTKESCIDIEEAFMGKQIVLQEDNNLAQIILGLPPKMRDILLLHYDNGYSTLEISKMLNMKQNTVQKNITRAKRIINSQLNNLEKEV